MPGACWGCGSRRPPFEFTNLEVLIAMQELETERLRIRSFVPEDWTSLWALILWFNATPFAAYDRAWPTTARRIKGLCRRFAATDSYRAVCLKQDGRFIGYICLNLTEENRVFNLGYCFHGDFHGYGYAFEACRAVIDVAFAEGKAEKIVTGTAQNNIASCRLLEKLGMTLVRSVNCTLRPDNTGNPVSFIGNMYELPGKPQE